MSLELLNTLGTLLTVAIVSATAIAALVQLRHLRAGNQINAMLSIGDRFQSAEFRNELYLVQTKLPGLMEQEDFRRFVASIALQTPVPEVSPIYREVRDAAITVGNVYEELGILVRNDIIDRTLFLDRYCTVIIGAWSRLEKFTAFIRKVRNDDATWENFELITVFSKEWSTKYLTSYPKGVPRLNPTCSWPTPTLSASA
ncbi:MAG TPA: DUF4760 domain-containing protein [Candidatus Acidoferrales bacterium]|nr:DUF4760 domain-containing protein [Candidatus Acidoferrales bacterium]